MSEIVLKTTELTKTYSKKNAVDHINLEIKKGEIYGFLGKNGAGKTTLMKMITGVSSPTSGSIELFESNDLSSGRKRIGTVIENPSFMPHFSARQNIELQRITLGVSDKSITNDLLEIVGLQNAGKKKAKNLSLGMKQRLGIALALVGNPEFLFLDEPMNGLDPIGVKELRQLILKLNQELGITVMISSHIISELTKIATCYGIINEGVLVSQISSEELKEKIKPYIKLKVNEIDKAVELLGQNFGIENIEKDESDDVLVYEDIEKFAEIKKLLDENEITVFSISQESGNPEDYFIKLMEGGNKRV